MLSLITSDGIADYSIMMAMVYVTLAAIIGSTILVSYLYVKSLKLIWRSGTCRLHLWAPHGRPIFMWVSVTWWRDRVSLGPSNGCRASTYFIAMLIPNIFTHFFHHYPFKKTYCVTHVGFRFYINWVIFKYIVVIANISISDAIVFRWILQDPIDDKSTLVWGMDWCRLKISTPSSDPICCVNRLFKAFVVDCMHRIHKTGPIISE